MTNRVLAWTESISSQVWQNWNRTINTTIVIIQDEDKYVNNYRDKNDYCKQTRNKERLSELRSVNNK